MGKPARFPKSGSLRVARAWENFEDGVGGRSELIDLLEYSGGEGAERLLAHLSDPRAERQRLRRLCIDARISFPQLYSIFSDALKAKNRMQALLAVSKHVVQVINDIAEDAVAHAVYCPVCKGTGSRRDPEGSTTCYRCEGTGKVREPGRRESAELFLRVAGLLDETERLHIVQNVVNVAAAPPPTMEGGTSARRQSTGQRHQTVLTLPKPI